MSEGVIADIKAPGTPRRYPCLHLSMMGNENRKRQPQRLETLKTTGFDPQHQGCKVARAKD